MLMMVVGFKEVRLLVGAAVGRLVGLVRRVQAGW